MKYTIKYFLRINSKNNVTLFFICLLLIVNFLSISCSQRQVKQDHKQIHIGIDAPKDVSIWREELFDKVKASENKFPFAKNISRYESKAVGGNEEGKDDESPKPTSI